MGRKCQAVYCRSGYDLTREEVAMQSEGNVPESRKFTVRSFPTNIEQRRLWVKALRRDDSVDTKNGGICDRHFLSDDFLRTNVIKTGADRKNKRLKPNVIPSVWPDYPMYYADNRATEPRSEVASSSARHEKEELMLDKLEMEFMADDTITGYDNLVDKVFSDTGSDQPSVLRHNFK